MTSTLIIFIKYIAQEGVVPPIGKQNIYIYCFEKYLSRTHQLGNVCDASTAGVQDMIFILTEACARPLVVCANEACLIDLAAQVLVSQSGRKGREANSV